jgi:hypothetical protein
VLEQEQDARFRDRPPSTGAKVRAAIKGIVTQGKSNLDGLRTRRCGHRAMPVERGALLLIRLALGHAATVVGVGPVHIRVM